MDNFAAVLYDKMDLRVSNVGPLKRLGVGEVRVRIQRVGICGSDVHYWEHGRCGPFVLNRPMVIGHESAGVVDCVGEGVTNLKIGDRVALEPGVPCLSCSNCLTGRYNLCREMKFFATPPVDGSLALFVTHPASFCHILPEVLTLEEGAFCEPLSVGIHACNRAGVRFGSTVLVLGSGPIGLLTILVAKAYGATTIIATDALPHRLEMAIKCGATGTINVTTQDGSFKLVADIVVEIRNLFTIGHSDNTDRSPDICIDCTGFEHSLQTAMMVTKSGGRVCIVGMGQDMVCVPLTAAAAREIDIVGIFRYVNTYPTCINLMASGAIDVKPLITHRYGFSNDEVLTGFEMAKSGAAVKVMFCLPCTSADS